MNAKKRVGLCRMSAARMERHPLECRIHHGPRRYGWHRLLRPVGPSSERGSAQPLQSRGARNPGGAEEARPCRDDRWRRHRRRKPSSPMDPPRGRPQFQEEDSERKLKKPCSTSCRRRKSWTAKNRLSRHGGGFLRIPLEVCARVTMGAVMEYLEKANTQEIVFCLRDLRELKAFQEHLQGMRG